MASRISTSIDDRSALGTQQCDRTSVITLTQETNPSMPNQIHVHPTFNRPPQGTSHGTSGPSHEQDPPTSIQRCHWYCPQRKGSSELVEQDRTGSVELQEAETFSSSGQVRKVWEDTSSETRILRWHTLLYKHQRSRCQYPGPSTAKDTIYDYTFFPQIIMAHHHDTYSKYH